MRKLRYRAGASQTGFPASPYIGQLLSGRYRVQRVLGEARGTLLLAQSPPNQVVVRLVPPHSVERPSFSGDRVASAARAAAQLGSAHVAHVLDVGEDVALGTYIVTEYLEGETLAAVLARQLRLNLETIVDYMLQACDALAEAHARGIVHAGIRTSNLFCAGAPGAVTLKLLDFGLGAALAGWLQDARFKSPEQLQGERGIDHRTDIWALGVVLYELSTGHVPFDGATPSDLFVRVLTERARPLSPERFAEPAWAVEILQNVIARCLRRDPAARFAEVEQLAYALVPLAPTSQRYGRWVPQQFRSGSMSWGEREAVRSSGCRDFRPAATDPRFSDSDDDEGHSSYRPPESRFESGQSEGRGPRSSGAHLTAGVWGGHSGAAHAAEDEEPVAPRAALGRPVMRGSPLTIPLIVTLVAVAISLIVFIDGRWKRPSPVHASALPMSVAVNRAVPMLIAAGDLDRPHAIADARSATTLLERAAPAAGLRITLYREGEHYELAIGPFADLESASQSQSLVQAALASASPAAFTLQDLRSRCAGTLSHGHIEGVSTYDCETLVPPE